jgi:hypothetical protein
MSNYYSKYRNFGFLGEGSMADFIALDFEAADEPRVSDCSAALVFC